MNRWEQYEVVIVAAGRSRRMGTSKPLLPLGEETVVERTIRNFKEAGVENITVVTGYRGEEVQQKAAHMSVKFVHNAAYADTDMLASVCLGIAALKKDTKGVLVCPADVPLISPQTIENVLECMEEGDCKIVVPTWQGEMGRPPLFSREAAVKLTEWKQTGGLRKFLEDHQEACRFLPVEDAMICQDMDTPEDYEKVTAILNRKDGEETGC